MAPGEAVYRASGLPLREFCRITKAGTTTARRQSAELGIVVDRWLPRLREAGCQVELVVTADGASTVLTARRLP